MTTGLGRRASGMASLVGRSIMDTSVRAGAHLPETGKAGC
jgi:hypothetical protein